MVGKYGDLLCEDVVDGGFGRQSILLQCVIMFFVVLMHTDVSK